MLTEAQVAKARTFPGCGDINADNAVDKLFAAADGLQNVAKDATDKNTALSSENGTLKTQLADAQGKIPRQTDPAVLKAMAGAARIHLKSATDAQAITPAAATALASALIGEGDNLIATGLTPDATGDCMATKVFAALATNGKAPNVGTKVEGQAVAKVATGAPDTGAMLAEADKEIKDWQNRQLAQRGFATAQ